MTGQEIIDHFEYLIDDDVDSDRELILLQIAYDRVNSKRVWHYLDSEDTSKTVLAGTRSYALPTAFLFPRSVRLYSSASKFGAPLKPVAFRNRHNYEGVQGYYYIDVKNGTLVLTADPSSSEVGKTIYFDYSYLPTAITVSTSPVFLRSYHVILAYEMARIFWYPEQDEKARSWDKEFEKEYDDLFEEMEHWDSKLDAGLEPDTQPEDAWVPPELT